MIVNANLLNDSDRVEKHIGALRKTGARGRWTEGEERPPGLVPSLLSVGGTWNPIGIIRADVWTSWIFFQSAACDVFTDDAAVQLASSGPDSCTHASTWLSQRLQHRQLLAGASISLSLV